MLSPFSPAFNRYLTSLSEIPVFDLGKAYFALQKYAADVPETVYDLTGTLYKSQSGWILLSVPNAFGKAIFESLADDDKELELPLMNDKYTAHISVFRDEEVEKIGADKIKEIGDQYRYTLGPLQKVTPDGQSDEFDKVWFVQVKSPELEELRKSYGLSALPYDDHEFHITVAVRKR